MLLSLSLLLACSNEIDATPAATVTPTPAKVEAPAPPPAAPAGDGLALKTEGSTIAYVGAKITGTHDGSFKSFQGSLVVSDGKPVSTTVSVDMSSSEADHPKLTKHLLSPDFFDVGAFATGTFTSSSIVAAESGYTVTGALEFHGVSNEITFPATITVTDGAASAKAEFKIDRQLWGISYPGKKDDLIQDDVALRLDLSFGS